MTRKQAKGVLLFIQAYTEGKTVQRKISDIWKDIINGDIFDVYANPNEYRIEQYGTS